MSAPQAAAAQTERMAALVQTIRRLMEKLQKELEADRRKHAQADDSEIAA